MDEQGYWIFIVNPTSGGGFGSSMIGPIEEQIKKRGLKAHILITERHGHATELTRKYLDEGHQRFISVGGDGTFNEMATVLVGLPGITTGLIPAGTGNDFAHVLGFPDRFNDTTWDVLFSQKTIRMDAGLVNGKHFFNGMGLGFDAQVAAENYVEPDEVASGSGKGKYIWHILKTLLFYRESKVKIRIKDEVQQSNCFINTIANGRRFAGSFYLTPKALANDGLLDVCMIEKLNLFQRLRILTMVPKGTHISDPKVKYREVPEIQVDFGKKVPYHIDGELFFDTKFDVSVIPEALNMIYNPGGPHYFK